MGEALVAGSAPPIPHPQSSTKNTKPKDVVCLKAVCSVQCETARLRARMQDTANQCAVPLNLPTPGVIYCSKLSALRSLPELQEVTGCLCSEA